MGKYGGCGEPVGFKRLLIIKADSQYMSFQVLSLQDLRDMQYFYGFGMLRMMFSVHPVAWTLDIDTGRLRLLKGICQRKYPPFPKCRLPNEFCRNNLDDSCKRPMDEIRLLYYLGYPLSCSRISWWNPSLPKHNGGNIIDKDYQCNFVVKDWLISTLMKSVLWGIFALYTWLTPNRHEAIIWTNVAVQRYRYAWEDS